ncbi:helix-turn-helix domain-containing protein [Kaarinaea lacus]
MMSDVVEEDAKESTTEETHSVMPGQKLKRARENRNLEQADIAKELKLDLRFVKALEEGRFNELPQPVYTAGYVRAYSKLVGLMPDEIVSEYSTQQKASVKKVSEKKEKEHIPSHYRHVQTDLPKSFSVGHSQGEDRRKFNILISILAVVVVFAIVWQVSNKSTEPTTGLPAESDVKQPADDVVPGTPEPTESLQKKTGAIGTTEQNTIDLPLPKLDSQSSNSGLMQSTEQKLESASVTGEEIKITNELVDNADKITQLSIYYTEDSWVDIRDATGKPIIRKLGIAGRSNTVSGVAPFEVLLGYSPGVSIELDGKPYDMSPYSKKRVARFVLDEGSSGSTTDSSRTESSQATERENIPSAPESENSLSDDF